MRTRAVLFSTLCVAMMISAGAHLPPTALSQQGTSTTSTMSSSPAGPDPTKVEVSTVVSESTSVVLQATVTDLGPSPSNPKGYVNWSDGGAGGEFANSGACTLRSDVFKNTVSLCYLSYTTGGSPSSPVTIVFTASYQGDSSHAPSSGQITLTLTGGGITTTTSSGETTTSTSGGGPTTTTSGTVTTETTSGGGATGGATTTGVVGEIPGVPQATFVTIVALLVAGSYFLFTRVALARRVLRGTAAKVGLALIAFILFMMLYGLYLDPYPVRAFPCLYTCSSLPPFADIAHPFGTYATGQDVFSEVAHGASIDLTIGLVATAVAVFVGTTIGVLAGYGRRMVQDVSLAFIQIVLLLPSFAIVVWVYRTYGNTELFTSSLLTNYLAILLGLFAWPPIALVVRNSAKTLQQAEFVVAARALGADTRRVVVRHILPNMTTSIISIASIVFATCITSEALFTYLGLVDYSSDTVTWGFLLGEGKSMLFGHWWASFFPGVAIVITVLGFSLVGDAISEALNPKAGVRL